LTCGAPAGRGYRQRSVRELERAIKDFIHHHNRDPKPFWWVKTADQILASIARFAQRTARDPWVYLLLGA
jgi:hypothetical protein